MKIFISWSGNRSRAIAEALHDWLSRVIQAVEPFYTPYMEKGVKWSNEIDEALEGTRFGIVCLTPDNLHSDWIHYETGALSKTKDAVIWTFLHGLAAGDVPQPLGRFQHTVAEKEDVLKLLHSINSRLREVGTGALKDSLLEEIFEETWSKFEAKLKEAESLTLPVDTDSGATPAKIRDEKDLLNEILEAVRNQQRQINELDEKIENRLFSQPRVIASSKLSRLPTLKKESLFGSVQFQILKNNNIFDLTDSYLRGYLNNIYPRGNYIQVTELEDHFVVRIIFESPKQEKELLDYKGMMIGHFGDSFWGWTVFLPLDDDDIPF